MHDTLKLINELTDESFQEFDSDKLLVELDDLEYKYDNDGILKFIKKYAPEAFEDDYNLINAIKENR